MLLVWMVDDGIQSLIAARGVIGPQITNHTFGLTACFPFMFSLMDWAILSLSGCLSSKGLTDSHYPYNCLLFARGQALA
jgi:hypothetical protein